MNREELSRLHFYGGKGIEIGAGTYPLQVAGDPEMTYVDSLEQEDLEKLHGPNTKNVSHVIEDAEHLGSFREGQFDFLVANHVLEHCENTILTMKNWMRVLRKHGKAMVALPERTQTFDRRRWNTAWGHILEDHVNGPEAARKQHYWDWYKNSELEIELQKKGHEAIYAAVEDAMARHQNIHWHAWDFEAMAEMMGHLSRIYCFDILHGDWNGSEVIWILRKR